MITFLVLIIAFAAGFKCGNKYTSLSAMGADIALKAKEYFRV